MNNVVRIGIDPDIDKNGFALITHQPFTKPIIAELKNLDFFDLLKQVNETHKEHGTSLTVWLEAAWLIPKSNWHRSYTSKKTGKTEQMSSLVLEKASKNVGENHAVGKLIELFLKKQNIQYKLYKPNTSNAKWDANWLKKVTGYDNRTNQEQRDAVRAAWI